MKENEAPWKIYLTSDEKNSYVFTQKRSDNMGVEYTRTDAFIEKVWNWIDKNFHESEIDTKYGESVICVISELCMCKDDIREKFENYMKGE